MFVSFGPAIALSAALIAAGVASAKTALKTAGIKAVDQWIVDQTDLALKEAPTQVLNNGTTFGWIDTPKAWADLWKAWRGGDTPKIDFTKHIVLVLTHEENAQVDFTLDIDNKGDLKIGCIGTERAPRGKTFVLAVIERAGVKAILGKAVKFAP